MPLLPGVQEGVIVITPARHEREETEQEDQGAENDDDGAAGHEDDLETHRGKGVRSTVTPVT